MVTYFEPDTGWERDPSSVVGGCLENGSQSVLLDESAIPVEFFDLGSRLAGELLHKLGTYRIRLAAVVADPSLHPRHFQEFLRETNRGTQFRFFATRQKAVEWLERGGG